MVINIGDGRIDFFDPLSDRTRRHDAYIRKMMSVYHWDLEVPKSTDSCQLFPQKGPYDCGVFVIKYGYNIMATRNAGPTGECTALQAETVARIYESALAEQALSNQR